MLDPVGEFELYRQDLFRRLGNDDPLDVFRTTIPTVSNLVLNTSEERLQLKPAPDEWSAWEVVNHLTDTEWVYGVRVRMIVVQHEPILVGYDQATWVTRFGPLDSDLETVIGRWQLLRHNNLRLYESLSAEEWERVGMHTERGPESVRLMVRMLGGHDRLHIEQIQQCLAQA